MDDIEKKMKALALEQYGTDDLSKLSGGVLEVLEKEATGQWQFGQS